MSRIAFLGVALTGLLAGSPVAAQGVGPPFQDVVIDPVTGSEEYNEKVLADVNGDGWLDVVAQNGTDGMFWYRNPDWSSFEISSWSFHGEEAMAADVDGDGDTDIVASGRRDREPVWYENPASEGADLTTTSWEVHSLGVYERAKTSHDLEIADVDQNGRLDVIMYGGILFQTGDDVWSFVESGDILPGRDSTGTGSGDIDGDGDVDVIAADTSHEIAWWENPLPGANPRTTPWAHRAIGPAWGGTSSQLGDLDGDGYRDVVVAPYSSEGGLFWYRAPVDPKATNAIWLQTSIDPSIAHVHDGSIHIRDFDGDGTPDIFLSEQEQSDGDAVAIYYNDGFGDFTKALLATTGGFNTKVGDIDLDGDFDLLNAPSGYYGAENPLTVLENLPEPSQGIGLALGAAALLAAGRFGRATRRGPRAAQPSRR